LLRIKRDAVLAKRFRADVKECVVIVGGFGDLVLERALRRSETRPRSSFRPPPRGTGGAVFHKQSVAT
jgi:hypothetical protein